MQISIAPPLTLALPHTHTPHSSSKVMEIAMARMTTRLGEFETMATRLGDVEAELSAVRQQVLKAEEERTSRHQRLLEPMREGLSTAVKTSTYLQIALITITMAALEVQDR